MDGDDQNENDRWVIENNMWHFQVISIMHMAYGMLTLWGVCVSGLANRRLNLTSADVQNYVFMEWSGLSPDFPRLAGPSWRCSQIFG